MPQFLIAIQHAKNYDPSLEDKAMHHDIDVLNDEMMAKGIIAFMGGLESADKAKTLRKQPGGQVVATDGPYLEAKEYIGGFWVLQCADMDEALEWGRKGAAACRASVEVREFKAPPTE